MECNSSSFYVINIPVIQTYQCVSHLKSDLFSVFLLCFNQADFNCNDAEEEYSQSFHRWC